MKTLLLTELIVLCTALFTSVYGQFNLVTTQAIPGSEPMITLTGDVNGDGQKDIVLLCRPTNPLGTQMRAYVYQNLTSGFFSIIDSFTYFVASGTLPEADEPHGGALRDMNHDGFLDLIMAYSNTLEIRNGDGSGNFSTVTGTKYNAPATIGGIFVFDVDNDQWEDVIYTQVNSNDFQVLYYDGIGGYIQVAYTDTSIFGHHFGLDPVVAYRTTDTINTTVVVIANTTPMVSAKPLTYHVINIARERDTLYYKNSHDPSESYVRSIGLIQYDSDYEMEIVAAKGATDGYIQIWNHSTLESPMVVTPTAIGYPYTAVVANMDCDEHEEVFIKYAINDTASIWDPYDESMTYLQMPYSNAGLYSTQIVLDDMNDDRMPDLVYGSLYGGTGYQLYVYEDILGSDSLYLDVRLDSFFTLETLDESTTTDIDTIANNIYLDTTIISIVRICVYYDTSDVVLRGFYCDGTLSQEDIISVSWRGMSDTTCQIDTNVLHASDTLLLNADNTTFNIYVRALPNPTRGMILLEHPMNNTATVEIYNCTGKKVYTHSMTAQQEWIDLSFLSSGIYMVIFRQTPWKPIKIIKSK